MSYFIAFCSKKILFVPNLALIVLGDFHHLQGGMKFATQISPLLNLRVLFLHLKFRKKLGFFLSEHCE
jgi:hypothetical protein